MSDTRNTFELLTAYSDDKVFAQFIRQAEAEFLTYVDAGGHPFEYYVVIYHSKKKLKLLHDRYKELEELSALTEEEIERMMRIGLSEAILRGNKTLIAHYNNLGINLERTCAIAYEGSKEAFDVTFKSVEKAEWMQDEFGNMALLYVIASGNEERTKWFLEKLFSDKGKMIDDKRLPFILPFYAIKSGQKSLCGILMKKELERENQLNIYENDMREIVDHSQQPLEDLRDLVDALPDEQTKARWAKEICSFALRLQIPNLFYAFSATAAKNPDDAKWCADILLQVNCWHPKKESLEKPVLDVVNTCVKRDPDLLYRIVWRLNIQKKINPNNKYAGAADEACYQLVRSVDKKLTAQVLENLIKKKGKKEYVDEDALNLIQLAITDIRKVPNNIWVNRLSSDMMKLSDKKDSVAAFKDLLERVNSREIELSGSRDYYYATNLAIVAKDDAKAAMYYAEADKNAETAYLTKVILLCLVKLKAKRTVAYMDYCKNNLYMLTSEDCHLHTVLAAPCYVNSVEADSLALKQLFQEIKKIPYDFVKISKPEAVLRNIGQIVSSIIRMLDKVNQKNVADAEYIKNIKLHLIAYFEKAANINDLSADSKEALEDLIARLDNLVEPPESELSMSSDVSMESISDSEELSAEDLLNDDAPEISVSSAINHNCLAKSEAEENKLNDVSTNHVASDSKATSDAPSFIVLPITPEYFLTHFPPFTKKLFDIYGGRLFLFGGAMREYFVCSTLRDALPLQMTLDYDYKLYANVDEVKKNNPQATFRSEGNYAPVTILEEGVEHEITLHALPESMTVEEHLFILSGELDYSQNTIFATIIDGKVLVFNPRMGIEHIQRGILEFADPLNAASSWMLDPSRSLRGFKQAYRAGSTPSPSVLAEHMRIIENPLSFVEACKQKNNKTKLKNQYSRMFRLYNSYQVHGVLLARHMLVPLILADIIAYEKIVPLLMKDFWWCNVADILLEHLSLNLNLHKDLARGVPRHVVQEQYDKMIATFGRRKAYSFIYWSNMMPAYLFHSIIDPRKEFKENANEFGVTYAQQLVDVYCEQHYIPPVNMSEVFFKQMGIFNHHQATGSALVGVEENRIGVFTNCNK